MPSIRPCLMLEARHIGLKYYEIRTLISWTKTSFPWARERVGATKRASETSCAEQANEWAVRADERMAQYSTRQFHSHSSHFALASDCAVRIMHWERKTEFKWTSCQWWGPREGDEGGRTHLRPWIRPCLDMNTYLILIYTWFHFKKQKEVP